MHARDEDKIAVLERRIYGPKKNNITQHEIRSNMELRLHYREPDMEAVQ